MKPFRLFLTINATARARAYMALCEYISQCLEKVTFSLERLRDLKTICFTLEYQQSLELCNVVLLFFAVCISGFKLNLVSGNYFTLQTLRQIYSSCVNNHEIPFKFPQLIKDDMQRTTVRFTTHTHTYTQIPP